MGKIILESVYYDLGSPAAYTGAEKRVYEEARKRDPAIRRADVREFLQNQFTYTLHRGTKRKFKRLATVPNGLHTDWQCDLCVFDKIKRQNDGYPYALNCIDVLSRKIFVVPVKSKSPKDMIPAFDKIFALNNGVKPHKIYTDQGLEFEAKAMRNYFRDKGILKRLVYSPDIHCGVVERANRTLKSRLYRYFSRNNTTRWVDVVGRIVDGINNSVNRTIGMAPNQVTFENADFLWQKLYKDKGKGKIKFTKGDIVRISKAKGVFEKGYLTNYTDELFRISEVDSAHNPASYRLEDLNGEQILGVFYAEELVLTSAATAYRIAEVLKERQRRGVKELFVSWVGFGPEYNSWIRESDLV